MERIITYLIVLYYLIVKISADCIKTDTKEWSCEFSGYINDSIAAIDVAKSPETEGIFIQYDLVMHVNKHPKLLHMYVNKTHVHINGSISKQEYYSALRTNQAVIRIGKGTLGCITEGSGKSMVHCRGEKRFVLPEKHTWAVAFVYKCDNATPEKLNIRYTIHMSNQKITPVPVFASKCDKYIDYNYTGFPNILGYNDIDTVQSKITDFGNELNTTFRGCYQHTSEVGCKTFIPEFRGGRLIPACKKACLDFIEACKTQLKKFGNFVHCPYLPDSKDPNICVHKEIMCPQLQQPANGKVVLDSETRGLGTKATYSCNVIFKPDLIAMTRTCQYSGEWSGHEIKCIYKIKIIIVILLAVAVAVGILMVFIVGKIVNVMARNEILGVLMEELVPFKDTLQTPLPPAQLVYDCFVWHHLYEGEQTDPADYRFVTDRETGLRILLENENGFRLFLPSRNMQPGGDSLESTVDAIRQSASAIIVVSEDLLKDGRNRFAIQMCMLRLISDKKFKIIFIYMKDPKIIGAKVPTLMRLSFWDQYVYLRKDSPQFKQQLILSLIKLRLPEHDEDNENSLFLREPVEQLLC